MNYYMDKNADKENYRSVHMETCSQLPDSDRRMNLGECTDTEHAVTKGTKYFTYVKPCPHCCK